MKWFCCGLPRTGTQSITVVAKMMGLQTSHPRQGGIVAYDEAEFFADTPIWADWQDLAKQFPDARFILTHRDEDLWVKSFCNVLGSYSRLLLKSQLPPSSDPILQEINRKAYKKKFKSAAHIEEQKLRMIYQQHNAEVVEYMRDNSRNYLMLDITQPRALTAFKQWMTRDTVHFPKVR